MKHPTSKKGSRLYNGIAARLPLLSPRLHLILFFLSLVAMDLGFRWIFRFAQTVDDTTIRKLLPFTLGWALLFTAIASLLPRRARQFFIPVIGLLFSVLCVVHAVFINMFRKFFSFADMAYAGDGLAFADLSYLMISKKLLLGLLLCLAVTILAALLVPPASRPRWTSGAATAVVGIAAILITRFAVLGTSTTVIWDETTNPAFLYEDFSDSKTNLTMLGIYQYTFRDLVNLLPARATLSSAEQKEIADFAAGRTHEANEMSGLLEGKNLILVQLEAIDTWMIDYMPALRALKEQSVVFANHYTPAYITAGTFNTEFLVNVGLLPATAGTSTTVYSSNAFPSSLANLFRNKGYTANSFHGSPGNVYNRAAIHENWGYETYHSGNDMGMENYMMDSQLTAAFGTMTADDPFFSFVITYSGHGPYGEENPIYQAHRDQAVKQAARTDGNYVYAVGHAMETDLFVQNLMAELESSGLLENTVVAFYADHYNYYMLNDALNMDIKGVDSMNLLQHTDFFIYSKDLEPRTVEKYTSSIDVLPTLANLFGLDAQYELLTGHDAFSQGGGYVFFNDNTWLGSEENLLEEIVLRRKINGLLLSGNFWAE